ncbi:MULTISPECIES: phage tail protein [unclassified Pseudomonas]|uniref:phage tail protein n=1 Tax=unclassified Pseudomonas TaxID=196821 RepID=UPI000BCBF671|nr:MULTISPECIES: phage tail protein [unclassified Pseudomonas]PVZ19915.1 putative phage tail protein [Pseudomonas sp. URIL14HWK12:I12]PVZ26981.1 putative phage tail protein [Pseudomonas sp. URIL14HWK12:I10]PVZ37870.1 putative phage tail protein [Pseudomonas sp. URIL14HWK12:I11]SNZ05337.1 Phage-related protein, tail component [Pseudomonas sp. URIL14HWK12:I9]
MGAAERIEIHGAKGGSSKAKEPYEASDSLRSTNLAKILIAVGEGEFDGTPTNQDIYLDNTPIADAGGNVNFPGVKWEWRPGSVEQSYIPGIPSVENETTVNVELRSESAWVRSLTNSQLSAVRVRLAWPALQQQDNEGNVGGYRIAYAIDVATDGGAFQQVLSEAVDGKTTTRYERSRRIDLPKATSGWQIRVRRLTANQNSNRIADTMLLAGYTEVIDAKLRYPNTALLYIEFDAEQFTNIPAVTVRARGRRWQVPSNYDPDSRTYTGIWDGSLKEAWTNNPAWITFGICTQDRFGLGKRIKAWMVDKWELYRIAQYCDQLVSDGLGGQEPRFLCDMNLQGKADAWSLLRDISAIYRGMTYWAQGQLVMQADMPRAQDIDYVFTRANVVDGKFSYGSASVKTRYTRALVSYDNPQNNYDTDVTVYADTELQRRYGDKPTELSAIGCTRASEAQRRGNWVVMSNNQDRTVAFSTGMEGSIPLPGFIIPVADSLLAGRQVGGRISAATATTVTLDRGTLAKAGDRLIINLPSGQAQARTVRSVAGRVITVTTAYSEAPAAQLAWALDADDLAIPLYRVLTVKRNADGKVDITALQYEPSKFDHIDSGARLEQRPISAIPVTTVPAPASITLSSTYAIDQGLAVSTMTIAWPAVDGAVGYDVEWRKDSGNWIKVQRTGTTNVDIAGIYAGSYLARVRAVSAFDVSSTWRESVLTRLNGKEGLPPAVASLTALGQVFGIQLKWTFPPGAEDTQRTEIWYSTTTSRDDATKLSDLAYPQAEYLLQGLSAGVRFFFWARLIDRTGNVGPWYPTGGGVMGMSGADAGPILDYLAGQIGETELGKDLANMLEGLQDQIDAFDSLSAYNPEKTYGKGEIVIDGGRIYQAAQAVPVETPPPNAAYWRDVGEVLETANGLAQQVDRNSTDIEELDGQITATASQVRGLQAAYRDDDGNGDMDDAVQGWQAQAKITEESKTRATADEALAQRMVQLEAEVGDNLNARITDIQETIATNEGATARHFEQLEARAGDNEAVIKQVSEAQAGTDGKLQTMWSVKMQLTQDGRYVAAGIGLGIENTETGLQSQFLVSADRFAVVSTLEGGTSFTPFVVQNGQVFISQAFIADGTLTMAKIAEALQSTNFVAGQTGWRMTKDGLYEINGNVAGGGRLQLTNTALRVFHPNGVEAIYLGL